MSAEAGRSAPVADAYDAIATRYAELFLRDLVDDTDAHPWLDRFVAVVEPEVGPVLDLGCGRSRRMTSGLAI